MEVFPSVDVNAFLSDIIRRRLISRHIIQTEVRETSSHQSAFE